jgi:membrane-associated phospholipid phosphatase
LLPVAARRPAAIITSCCAVIVAVLGAVVAGSSQPTSLDHSVDHWIQSHLATHARALTLLADLSEPAAVVVITLAIAVLCVAARRVNGALLAVISVPAATVLTELILKHIVGRTLNGNLVYPSGHAGRAFTFAAIIAVLLLDPPGTRLRPAIRIAIGTAAALVACAVAVAVVGLNWHYFTDTIGGAAVAIGVVLTTTFLLDRSTKRRPAAQRDGTTGTAVLKLP